MKYDIFKRTAPAMPKPGKGTEIVKLLLSQASKDMHEPLVPMFFPVLGAHVSGSEFQYPDFTWKELCGMKANLVGDSGCNKGQFSLIVEAINRNFREHDKAEMNKLVEWLVYHDRFYSDIFPDCQAFQEETADSDKVFSMIQTMLTSNLV